MSRRLFQKCNRPNVWDNKFVFATITFFVVVYVGGRSIKDSVTPYCTNSKLFMSQPREYTFFPQVLFVCINAIKGWVVVGMCVRALRNGRVTKHALSHISFNICPLNIYFFGEYINSEIRCQKSLCGVVKKKIEQKKWYAIICNVRTFSSIFFGVCAVNSELHHIRVLIMNYIDHPSRISNPQCIYFINCVLF